jgi:DNA-binding Lrp family transcriptional regulator
MAVTAYILIQTEVGKAGQVLAQVRAIPGVQMADTVTGPYEIICRVEAPTLDDLGLNVISRIQMADGITRTVTCNIVALA